MTTVYGGNKTNTDGNRSWKASLTYTVSSTSTTTTVSGVKLGVYLNTDASWTNVYFTTRKATFDGTNFINTSTQATLNWSGSGNKNITTVSTEKSWTRGCKAASKSVSFSVKHKESGNTSSGSTTISVPARALYTITFNGNGGTVTSGAKMVCANCSGNHKAYGYNSTISATATRTGYTFGGWNTETDGSGTNYANGATYSTNASDTLYAKWTEKTATLTYANGGHGTAPEAVTMRYTAATNAAAAITATGYTFTGWKRSDDSTVIAAGAQVKAANVVPAALTLTAQWSENTATLTYNNGGHGTAPANVTMKYTEATNAAAAISATGYTFTGWKRSDTSAVIAAGAQVKAANVNPSALTLTAQWSANSYTATFNPNGGSLDSNGNWGSDAGTTSSHGCTIVYGSSNYAAQGKATRTGYTFKGWYTASSGGTQVYDANGAAVSGDYWNGSGSTATWKYTGSPTFYAQWTEKTATLTYNANGHGTAPSAVTMKYTTATNASSAITATGYNFVKWNTESDGTGTSYNAGAQVKAANVVPTATTLYAIWSEKTATLTYNANGHGTAPAAVTMKYTTATNAAAAISATGYTFNGWNTKDDGTGTNYAAGATYKAANVEPVAGILYAKWTENAAQLTYNANGHGNAPMSRTLYYSKAQKAAPPIYAVGYVFTGWNTAANGSGTSYSPYSTLKAANVNPATTVLYAQWQNAWYVKVNGTWKPFTTSYVKANGTWKSGRRIVAKGDSFLRAFVILYGSIINPYYLPSVPMTWGQFIASSNNPGEFTVGSSNRVMYNTSTDNLIVYSSGTPVLTSDLIDTDITYTI